MVPAETGVAMKLGRSMRHEHCGTQSSGSAMNSINIAPDALLPPTASQVIEAPGAPSQLQAQALPTSSRRGTSSGDGSAPRRTRCTRCRSSMLRPRRWSQVLESYRAVEAVSTKEHHPSKETNHRNALQALMNASRVLPPLRRRPAFPPRSNPSFRLCHLPGSGITTRQFQHRLPELGFA